MTDETPKVQDGRALAEFLQLLDVAAMVDDTLAEVPEDPTDDEDAMRRDLLKSYAEGLREGVERFRGAFEKGTQRHGR